MLAVFNGRPAKQGQARDWTVKSSKNRAKQQGPAVRRPRLEAESTFRPSALVSAAQRGKPGAGQAALSHCGNKGQRGKTLCGCAFPHLFCPHGERAARHRAEEKRHAAQKRAAAGRRRNARLCSGAAPQTPGFAGSYLFSNAVFRFWPTCAANSAPTCRPISI